MRPYKLLVGLNVAILEIVLAQLAPDVHTAFQSHLLGGHTIPAVSDDKDALKPISWRIAAMVDRTNVGAGAEVGAENFSRLEKFAAAREAFDEWASRVRIFLDSAHELTGEDAVRADKAYQPYGAEAPAK